jgi:hypothetical protein
MPNWCENKLDVSGNEIDVQKFKELTLVKDDVGNGLHFTMEILSTTPSELLEQTSPNTWRGEETDIAGKLEFEKKIEELKQKYGHTDWYDWRVKNWGTKWDAAESYILDDEDEFFSIEYNTAWGPNIEWVRYVAKQFTELTFTLWFQEPGMGFCGVYEVTDEDEDLCEGDLEWVDEDGRKVEYDGELERYKYSDTKEVIDDEDFYPEQHNPFKD